MANFEQAVKALAENGGKPEGLTGAAAETFAKAHPAAQARMMEAAQAAVKTAPGTASLLGKIGSGAWKGAHLRLLLSPGPASGRLTRLFDSPSGRVAKGEEEHHAGADQFYKDMGWGRPHWPSFTGEAKAGPLDVKVQPKADSDPNRRRQTKGRRGRDRAESARYVRRAEGRPHPYPRAQRRDHQGAARSAKARRARWLDPWAGRAQHPPRLFAGDPRASRRLGALLMGVVLMAWGPFNFERSAPLPMRSWRIRPPRAGKSTRSSGCSSGCAISRAGGRERDVAGDDLSYRDRLRLRHDDRRFADGGAGLDHLYADVGRRDHRRRLPAGARPRGLVRDHAGRRAKDRLRPRFSRSRRWNHRSREPLATRNWP